MRLVKLSSADEEMGNRSAVVSFFRETLWRKSRGGRFGLTEDKSRMKGIGPGMLLVFTYKTECMFVARAASGISMRGYAHFVVDLGSIVEVSSPLMDYERALRRAGLLKKNLVKAQKWPKLSDACEAFTLRYFDYPGLQRFLFVRIGWMQHYRGSMPGDDRPVGGGKYNRTETGHEVYNFFPVRSRLYGYYQPQMRKDETVLERIDNGSRGKDLLDGVTIVFIAKRPEGGQVIVGWYRNARVYRRVGPRISARPRSFPGYRIIARMEDSVLLPEDHRRFPIPRGEGGIGQANVCYPLEPDGSRKGGQWLFQAKSYVNGYEGENLLFEPEADANGKVAAELEAAIGGRTGQGFRANAEERRAIEVHGMKRATKYFKGQGFAVEDVSRRRSYDLHCTKGDAEFRVEVKATTTNGATVFLTRREAELAAKPDGKTALFILHSIALSHGVPSGGRQRVSCPWRFSWKEAKAVVYSYRPQFL